METKEGKGRRGRKGEDACAMLCAGPERKRTARQAGQGRSGHSLCLSVSVSARLFPVLHRWTGSKLFFFSLFVSILCVTQSASQHPQKRCSPSLLFSLLSPRGIDLLILVSSVVACPLNTEDRPWLSPIPRPTSDKRSSFPPISPLLCHPVDVHVSFSTYFPRAFN